MGLQRFKWVHRAVLLVFVPILFLAVLVSGAVIAFVEAVITKAYPATRGR